MCEVYKWLEFLMLDVSKSMGREMLIIQWKYWSGMQVSTTEGNIRNNESKVKVNRIE